MLSLFSRYQLRNGLVAGGLALVGALLVFLYVVSYRNNVQNGAGLVQVFVAARDIPEGTDGATVAGGGYVSKKSELRRNVVAGAISSPSQISNLATAGTILAGEQITVRQFHSSAQQGVLANISGNLRAMTVPGENDQLLAGIVKDGDHVDVLASIGYSVRPPAGSPAASGGDLTRVVSRVILRDLLVLRSPGTTSTSTLGTSTNSGSSITLALSDTQAQKLLFGVKNGEWWLVLRPVAKPTDSPESVETIESILADGLGPAAISQLTGGYGAGSISSGR